MTVLRKLSAVAAAVSLSGAAAAQMAPNPPEAIASAAADCWSASGASAVDEARLRQLGWAAGSIRSPQGAAVDTPLRLYGKRGSSVVMMIMNRPEMSACTILSRVARPTDVGNTAQMMFTKLKAIDPAVTGGKGAKPGQIVYLALPRMAELSATGTRQMPGTRIVVAASAAKK